jgi:uncharacterized protein (TIGR03083 family)
MSVAELYNQGRHVLTELGTSLTPDEEAARVPACPGWTVKDVYAHLVGASADVLAGNLEGVATPPWTAKQVDYRADRTLTQILVEWAGTGPKLEDALKAIGDRGTERLIADQWSHEQDVRGTVGKRGSREAPRLAFLLDFGLGGFAASWPAALPTVGVLGESGRWTLGTGEPSITLTASDFELGRALLGRRSRAQYLALDWSTGDEAVVGPVVDHLHVFPFPVQDLVE